MNARRKRLNRLSQRQLVQAQDWHWSIRAQRAGRLRSRQTVTARVLELSVTGALVRCPPLEGIDVNNRVIIDAQGDVGSAVVRRIESSPDETIVEYGVEFMHLEDGLRDKIYAMTIPDV